MSAGRSWFIRSISPSSSWTSACVTRRTLLYAGRPEAASPSAGSLKRPTQELNALLEDVFEQTKEAELYAPSGTRHIWAAEEYPYAQGSDHDIFLGMGIPSTMLGHDPDWTHHTSEDTIDKTDASELRRVGVFATTAAVFMASADEGSWKRARALGK